MRPPIHNCEPGVRFNRLIIVECFRENNRSKVRCKCLCGKEIIYFRDSVIRGLVKSCGCYRKYINIKRGKVLSRRTKRNIWITHNDERLILIDWIRHYNLPERKVQKWMREYKFTFEQCLKLLGRC